MREKTLILSLILFIITTCLIFSQEGEANTHAESFLDSESTGETSTKNTRKRVTVIFTGDLEERLRRSLEGRFGLAEVSAVTDYARQRRNVLLLDAGGTTGMNTDFFAEYPELCVQMLEELGYDALVPGLSELEAGLSPLLELEEYTSFPVLCANLTTGDAATLGGHKILSVGGLRVGIFGLTTPGIENEIEREGPLTTFDIGDPLAAAERSVDALEAAGVDVLIALTHLGLADLYEQGYFSVSDLELAEQRLSGRVDLLIDGGISHNYTKPFELGAVVIMGTGGPWSIGGAEIVVAEGEVTDVHTRMIDAEEVAEEGLDPMPEVASLIERFSVAIESNEEQPETVQKPKEEPAEKIEPDKEPEQEPEIDKENKYVEKSELDQKIEIDKKPATEIEEKGFSLPQFELFFEVGPNFYSEATGYDLSLGVMSDLKEIFDFGSPVGNTVLGLLLRYDGLSMADEDLIMTSVGPVVFAGYRFTLADYAPNFAFVEDMRVIPRLALGGMSLNVSKYDRSAYSGFSGYVAPGVLVDKKLPIELDLRAGLTVDYNITFGETLWRSFHFGAFVSWIY